MQTFLRDRAALEAEIIKPPWMGPEKVVIQSKS